MDSIFRSALRGGIDERERPDGLHIHVIVDRDIFRLNAYSAFVCCHHQFADEGSDFFWFHVICSHRPATTHGQVAPPENQEDKESESGPGE
jgi:hypothetical protein